MKTAPDHQHFSITKWTLATFGGWMAGVFLILFFASLFGALGIETSQLPLGLGMGTAIGLVQWIILRKVFVVDYRWLLYSALGFSLPFLLLDLANLFFGSISIAYALPVCVAVGSLIVGTLQFTLLKPYFAQAKRWILAGFIAWMAAIFIFKLIDFFRNLSTDTKLMLAINLSLILLSGLALGLISGRFLDFIIKNEKQEQ